MLEQRDGLNSESQPTPFDPLGEAPARDPNTLPGYPKGWNPLVDGPLQGDEHAAQLWRDWQNAEGDRNEWAARWAWNRYVRYATGETGDPETPRVVDRRPFLNVLMSIRQRAIRDGDERLVTLVDASIDADAEAMTPQLIEGQLRLVRAHEELRRNWKRLRSSAEWWVRYYLDLGWQSECVQCVERDADGNVPAVDYIVPVGPRSVDAFVTSCLTCGRRP